MSLPKYELSFWLTSNFNESEAEQCFNELVKSVESLGAQILATQLPQLRSLSYPIKKETNGYFCFIQFQGEGLNLADLTRQLSLNNKILRFGIFKLQEKERKAVTHLPKYSIHSKEEANKKADSLPASSELSIEELDQKLNEILKE
ncbi:MAG: small subunit ribosomal protein [Patescibacteria group bacterium]|nr:small subunit ribosomal protein [Patescibacteria group bacterium]